MKDVHQKGCWCFVSFVFSRDFQFDIILIHMNGLFNGKHSNYCALCLKLAWVKSES